MILTACVYPITGLLFLCTFSIAGVWTAEANIDTVNMAKSAAVAASSAESGGKHNHARPVAGGNDVFTSSFLVRFRRSVDNDFAHSVANKYGFENLGAVSTYLISFYKHKNKIFILKILITKRATKKINILA